MKTSDIRFPIKFYAFALGITSIVLIGLGYSTYQSYYSKKNLQEHEFRLQEIRGSVIYLDEALSMLARMAALTGDLIWEKRYRQMESQWDSIVDQFSSLTLPHQSFLGKGEDFRKKLGEIENLVFTLVDQKNAEAARAIILGDEYRDQKQFFNKEFFVFGKTQSPLFLSLGLKDSLVYHREVLTTSVRMAALTGDIRWEKRFRNFEYQLAEIFEEIGEKVTFGKEILQQIKAANGDLVELENRAFSLIRRGQLKEARAVLFSSEFEAQRQSHIDWMEKFSQLLRENSKTKQAWAQKKLVFWVLIVLMILSVLFIAWLVVSKSFRNWQKALMKINLNLNQQTQELQRTNNHLIMEMDSKEKAEKNLKESETRLSGILKIAHEAIISIDESNKIIIFNKGAQKIFGYYQREVLGKPINFLIPGRFRSKPEEAISFFSEKEFLREDLGEPREVLGIRKSGEEFFGEASVSKLNTGSEGVVTVVLRDITDRKIAEDKLRKSEERFRQFAENIKEVLWMGDLKENKMIYVSPAFQEIWGRSPEPLYRSLDSWLDTIDSETTIGKVNMKNKELGNQQEEYQIIRPDGSRRWIRDRAFPIRDDQGKIYRLAGIAEDITERKYAQESLERKERQQRFVSEIGALFLKLELLNEAIEKAVLMVAEALRVPICRVLLLDADGKFLLPVAGVGGKEPMEVARGSQENYTLIVNGPVVTDDMSKESRFKDSSWLQDQQVVSSLTVPLESQNHAFGVIGLYTREVHSFTQEEIGFLESVANLIAIAVSRKKAEEALAEQAIRDPLTGLYNRRFFHRRVGEEIARAEKNNKSLAILLCDLDRFKKINDTRGHDAGDEILKVVAKSIQEATRGIDLVFRWGGDEVVVVLSHPTREGLLTAAEQIRKSVHRINSQYRCDLDISIGIALYPDHGRTPDELIRLADWALYISKQGGDKIHIGEEEYHLNENSVKVVFQSVVDIRSNQIIGYEALSRDPQGKLSPQELFRRYQAIGQLYELKTICFQLQLKKALELGLKRVFINVDFQLLSQIDIIPVPTDQEVILEISEMEALHDVENRLEIAQRWRGGGYQFAIDDFGAGFISLPFIAQFIPEYIKLDRSTVLQSVSSNKFKKFSMDLVKALRNYAKEGIIAEGVENENELRVVKEMGIHLVQGYLFGKPQELK